MNVKQAADLLGVSTDTIRRWAGEEYSQFMSPSATPAKGQTRAFTRHDLAVLKFVATLRESGIDRLDIFAPPTEYAKWGMGRIIRDP